MSKLIADRVSSSEPSSQGQTGVSPLSSIESLLDRARSLLSRRTHFGIFAAIRPASSVFGYDRGTPLDRYYIENFLARHTCDIKGRVLEVGDSSYSRRFGKEIVKQDVIHLFSKAPEVTLVGDLSQPNVLPPDAFDCIILTQTLHLIYDMRAAVKQLRVALRPSGVLLATVPGITPIDRGEWNASWFWSLTERSALRLFSDEFGYDCVEVSAHGNVYAAIRFLHGLSLEEVNRKKLDYVDPSYPIVVTIRARRRD